MTTTKWKGLHGNTRWFDPGNWSGGVPSSQEIAAFDDGGHWNVQLSTQQTAKAGALTVMGDVITLADGKLDLGRIGKADLTCADGGAVIIARNASVKAPSYVQLGSIDNGPQSDGTLTVFGALATAVLNDSLGQITVAQGGMLSATSMISIGSFGTGEYAGSLTVGGVVSTGELVAGLATIVVDGTAAHLQASVLDMQHGTLSVVAGGTVDAGNVTIGTPGALSVAFVVDGAGSKFSFGTLTNTGNSNSFLTVANGAELIGSAIEQTGFSSNENTTITGLGSTLSVGTFVADNNSGLNAIVVNMAVHWRPAQAA